MPDNKPSGGKKSYGAKKSFGAKRSFGEKKSYGDKPSFGEKRSYGAKPSYGEKKSYSDKPSYGEKKTYGDKPSYGEKKTYGDKPHYGEKPTYGEKKEYGERKSYGDKPAYGERMPYERKRYAAEVTNTAHGARDYGKRDMVQFRLEEEALDQLQTVAQQRGMSMGFMIRDWVLERLRTETGSAPAIAKAPRAVSSPEGNSLEDRLSAVEKRIDKLEAQ